MAALFSWVIGSLIVAGIVAAGWAVGDAKFYYRLACQRTSDEKHPLRTGTYGRLRREYAIMGLAVVFLVHIAARIHSDPIDLTQWHDWVRTFAFTAQVLLVDLILLWEAQDQRSMDAWFWRQDAKSASKHEVAEAES